MKNIHKIKSEKELIELATNKDSLFFKESNVFDFIFELEEFNIPDPVNLVMERGAYDDKPLNVELTFSQTNNHNSNINFENRILITVTEHHITLIDKRRLVEEVVIKY